MFWFMHTRYSSYNFKFQCILSARVEVFSIMFNSNFREHSEDRIEEPFPSEVVFLYQYQNPDISFINGVYIYRQY